MLSKAARLGGWALALSGAALSLQAAYLPAKAEVAQLLMADAFDEVEAKGVPVRPWSWADMHVIGRIAHDRLGQSDIVLKGGAGQAMAFGPALLNNVDSQAKIFSAHRDSHFRWLRDVEIGDRLQLDLLGAHEEYEVVGHQISRWDAFAVPSHPKVPLVALSTCYPFDSDERGPLRFIVWARLVDEG